ncbi:MAG: diguanylate cyclase domain-containing protein [Chloroflexota bacterium]
MSKLIRELLTTPPQNDVEANHRARRLNLILLGSLVITLPAGFILSLFDFPRRINFLAFLVIEALGLLALLLLRRGNLQPASYLSILFLSGGLTHAALSNGGLYSPLLTTTILLIPAVGYLIGARPGTLFAVLTVVEITALYLKERSDHSLQPAPPLTPESHLLYAYFNLSLALLSLYFVALRIQKTMALAHRRGEALEKKVSELQELQTSLEVRINSRTQEINQQRQYFEALVLHSPLAIAVTNSEHQVQLCNPAFERLFGYTLDEMMNRDLDEFVSTPNSYSQARVYTTSAQEGHQVYAITRRQKRSGEFIDVEIHGVPVMIEGQVIGMLAIYNDITERNRIMSALQESEQLFRTFFHSAGTGMIITHPEGNIQQVNRSFADMLGYQVGPLLTKDIASLVHPEDLPNHTALINQLLYGDSSAARSEIRFLHQQGDVIWGLLNMSLIRDPHNNPSHIICQIQDITERKEFEKQLHHLATHDPLTDLPNRALFFDRLEHAIRVADRNNHWLAVLFLDLDGYKTVNDMYGHLHGDQLLQVISRRLQTSLRQSDTVARIGGDEFAFILENIKEPQQIPFIVEKILTSVTQPLRVNNQYLIITASLGVSLFPTHGRDAQSLVSCADQAMYLAKDKGKNQIVYFSDISEA